MTDAFGTARRAATLLELLVVLGVIAVLVGLLLPAVARVRAAAFKTACSNNLRQIGLAVHLDHDVELVLPGADRRYPWPGKNEKSGTYLTWGSMLLPYLDQDALWRGLPAAYAAASDHDYPTHAAVRTPVRVYACPTDARLSVPVTDDRGWTSIYGSYPAVLSNHGEARTAMSTVQRFRLTDANDGLSRSLMIGERPPAGRYLSGSWYSLTLIDAALAISGYHYGSGLSVKSDANVPGCRGPFRFGPGRLENRCDTQHYWSLHGGGGHFLFVDGGVHFLTYSASDILPALATIDGGEVVEVP